MGGGVINADGQLPPWTQGQTLSTAANLPLRQHPQLLADCVGPVGLTGKMSQEVQG